MAGDGADLLCEKNTVGWLMLVVDASG